MALHPLFSEIIRTHLRGEPSNGAGSIHEKWAREPETYCQFCGVETSGATEEDRWCSPACEFLDGHNEAEDARIDMEDAP